MKKKTAKQIKPQVSDHLLSKISSPRGASQFNRSPIKNSSNAQNTKKLKSVKSTEELSPHQQKKRTDLKKGADDHLRGKVAINAPAVHINEKDIKPKEKPPEQTLVKNEKKSSNKKRPDSNLSPRLNQTKNNQINKNNQFYKNTYESRYKQSNVKTTNNNVNIIPNPSIGKSSPNTTKRNVSVHTKTNIKVDNNKSGSPKSAKSKTNKKLVSDNKQNDNKEFHAEKNDQLINPLNEQVENAQTKQEVKDDFIKEQPQQELVKNDNDVDESKNKMINDLIAQMDDGFRSIAEILKSDAFEGIKIPENLLMVDDD